MSTTLSLALLSYAIFSISLLNMKNFPVDSGLLAQNPILNLAIILTKKIGSWNVRKRQLKPQFCTLVIGSALRWKLLVLLKEKRELFWGKFTKIWKYNQAPPGKSLTDKKIKIFRNLRRAICVSFSLSFPCHILDSRYVRQAERGSDGYIIFPSYLEQFVKLTPKITCSTFVDGFQSVGRLRITPTNNVGLYR